MKKQIVLLALALGASTSLITAQEGKPPAGGPPGGGQRQPGAEGRPGGQGGPGGQRPPSPIIEALDVNKDGVIDADELAKAAESLKKLDKNGDGKLTEDEFRPQRPGGQGGPGAGPGGRGQGPGGQGGRSEGRPPGGGQGAPGGEAKPARPELEK